MDIDDDIMALVERGSTNKKRSKSSTAGASASKKKKASSSSRRTVTARDLSSDESDMDLSDGDDDVVPIAKRMLKGSSRGDEEEGAMYPVEGKYVDAEEKQRVKEMTEFDREAFLAERADQQTEAANRAGVRKMVERKERQAEGLDTDDDEEETTSRRTGRDRKASGATKEKARAMAKLKKQRAKKSQKNQDDGEERSDKDQTDGDDDDSDMNMKESEDEYEEEKKTSKKKKAEKEAKGGKGSTSKSNVADGIGPKEFKDLMITRDKMIAFSRAPWFGEWVKGGWVRLLVGRNEVSNQPAYRICRVEGISRKPESPYMFEGSTLNVWLTLRHATAVRDFSMDILSNSSFTDQEYDRLSGTLKAADMAFPDNKAHKVLKKQLESQTSYILTEAHLNAELEKKYGSKGANVNPAQGKVRLTIQRDHAISVGDEAGLEAANRALALLGTTPSSPAAFGSNGASMDSPRGLSHSASSGNLGMTTEANRMAKVNERNRASNREEIRKAEGKNQEERRKLAAALKRGDVDVKVDPSARVKTMTRLKYDKDEVSRPTTPLVGSPLSQPKEASGNNTPVTSAIPRAKVNKFEEMLAKVKSELDVDLDF